MQRIEAGEINVLLITMTRISQALGCPLERLGPKILVSGISQSCSRLSVEGAKTTPVGYLHAVCCRQHSRSGRGRVGGEYIVLTNEKIAISHVLPAGNPGLNHQYSTIFPKKLFSYRYKMFWILVYFSSVKERMGGGFVPHAPLKRRQGVPAIYLVEIVLDL